MKKLHHFYHIYGSGNWEIPAKEHLQALKDSGLINEIYSFNFGIVGNYEERKEVKQFLKDNFISFNVVAETESGFEQETMDAIYDYAKDHKGYVLYAHTKNASNINDVHLKWRKSMTYFAVMNWKECIKLMDEGYSAVGSHYLLVKNNQLVEDVKNVKNDFGVFAGTFWWTDLDYIKYFPRVERNNRFDAEYWISNLKHVVEGFEKEFKIYDFNPYHPGSTKGMIFSW
jgi:predicted secreted protein